MVELRQKNVQLLFCDQNAIVISEGYQPISLVLTGSLGRLKPLQKPYAATKRQIGYPLRNARPASGVRRSASTVSPAIAVCPTATIGGVPPGK
jgi:hypothetical protein